MRVQTFMPSDSLCSHMRIVAAVSVQL